MGLGEENCLSTTSLAMNKVINTIYRINFNKSEHKIHFSQVRLHCIDILN